MSMSRQKAISVKLSTVKVIAALEAALEKLESDHVTNIERETEYEKSYKAWKEELVKYASSQFSKAENIDINYMESRQLLSVSLTINIESGTNFPPQPKRVYYFGKNDERKDIASAIRILKMTDDEVVDTSTYNAIARYL